MNSFACNLQTEEEHNLRFICLYTLPLGWVALFWCPCFSCKKWRNKLWVWRTEVLNAWRLNEEADDVREGQVSMDGWLLHAQTVMNIRLGPESDEWRAREARLMRRWVTREGRQTEEEDVCCRRRDVTLHNEPSRGSYSDVLSLSSLHKNKTLNFKSSPLLLL